MSTLPDHQTSKRPGSVELGWGHPDPELLPTAEAAGVSYVPGARFFADGGGSNCLRPSFSLLPAAELEEGARRLGLVVGQVV